MSENAALIVKFVYVVATCLEAHADAVRLTEGGEIVATGTVGEFNGVVRSPEERQEIVRNRAAALAEILQADVDVEMGESGAFTVRFDVSGHEYDRDALDVPADPDARFVPGVWRWVEDEDVDRDDLDPHPDRTPPVVPLEAFLAEE